MRRQIFILFLAIFLLATLAIACATPAPTIPLTIVPPTSAPTPIPPSPVPVPAFAFPKGAMWTYEGVVKWDDKGKAQQKTLTWQMQIVDKIERGDGIVGYVMKGHPLDLAFYEEGKQPSDYLYLAKANRVYKVTLFDAKPIERVKNEADALTDLMDDETLVYDFPLPANKKFGPVQFISQGDKYVWLVNEVKPTKLIGIKGIQSADTTEYRLDFVTNPDWQILYFVANVGITRFVYHHNGTLSEVDVKLVEYTTGGSAANSTGPCEFVVSKEITVYTRPGMQATVFGKLPAGERARVSATTVDGWLGFDPGVAQAANVGPFRYRWVQRRDVQLNVATEVACGNLPDVASLPPTACFQMFMEDTKVYSKANSTSPVVVTAKPDDYAQVIAANDKWLQLDLNVGSLKQNKQGWIARADANFNGACDKLPAVKP